MEDDGLLLNFTTSSSGNTLSSKKLASLQGKKPKGSWRDRRDAKRAAFAANSAPEESNYKPPSFNRHRLEKKVPGGVSKHQHSQFNPKKTEAPPKDGIVSSLFTYNPEIPSQTATELEKNTERNNVDVESTNAPLKETDGFAVNRALQSYLTEKLHLVSPTQIQKSAIPAIKNASAEHKDVVMVAQTGSGKTLAYLLPILDDLTSMPQRIDRTSGIFAVILAPTRELASQIYQVCEELCRCCHYIVPGLVIGGEKKKSEKARLRRGVNILIGTPGRMADHVDNTARLDFAKTKYVVLDEGDRLIDLGFEETLTQILAAIPQTRTTLLCSATMNAQASRVKTLALSDPIVWVREKSENESHNENTPGQLIQRVAIVPGKLRLVSLSAICQNIGARSKRAVVFFSCTDSVDFHAKLFGSFVPEKKGGFNVFKLHGNMNQQQRTETITNFSKASNASILFTTDVASRGLDVTVDEVVEYDPPFTIEDHLHRAGRTARAGKRGEAIMFLLPSEEAYEGKLRNVHTSGLRKETYQSILQRGFGFSGWQDAATEWQLNIEKAVVANQDGIADLARTAFTAHIRAYTTHSHAEKSIFNFRNLHLGHLAKAFALRETPANIATGGSAKRLSGNTESGNQNKRKSSRQMMLEAAQRQLETDEYNVI